MVGVKDNGRTDIGLGTLLHPTGDGDGDNVDNHGR